MVWINFSYALSGKALEISAIETMAKVETVVPSKSGRTHGWPQLIKYFRLIGLENLMF